MLILPVIFFFTKCKEDGDTPNATEYNYNFTTGKDGWITGFAYYRAADSSKNLLSVAVADSIRIPGGQDALRFSGLNPDATLVTYLKRRLTNLQPEQRYEISIGISLYTNAPDTIRTTYRKLKYFQNPNLYTQFAPPRADTTQGRKINVIASISTAEPAENVTSGGIKQLSNYAPLVIGNTVNANGDSIKTFRSFIRRRTFSATTDASGSLWILVGTTSSYRYFDLNRSEYPWRYYIQTMNIRTQPF